MVGCDRIVEDRQRTRTRELGGTDRRHRRIEIRWLADIERCRVPLVKVPRPDWNLIPHRVLVGEGCIHAPVFDRIECRPDERIYFLHRWPYVAQIDVPSVDACERLVREIDVDTA